MKSIATHSKSNVVRKTAGVLQRTHKEMDAVAAIA